MRILISYPTKIGIFDIAQANDKKYHPVFNEDSLGSFDTVQDAVDALVSNNTSEVIDPETRKVVDTSSLGISEDYLEWDTNY